MGPAADIKRYFFFLSAGFHVDTYGAVWVAGREREGREH